MANEKSSVVQQAPVITTVGVDFDKPEFENLIYQKGYDVWHEKALKCGCRSNSTGGHQAQSDCQNCGGSGWFFINRTQTKMVLHSMNLQTKFLQWTEAKIGTVSISCMDVDKLGRMDRITVLQGESIYTETIHPVIYDDKLFAFLAYDILEIEKDKQGNSFVFMFQGSGKAHKLLKEGTDFTVESNKILLNKKYFSKKDVNYSIALRYKHRPVYHVWDIPRDAMVTDVYVGDSREPVQMPLHAIGMRVHNISDFDNLEGSRTIDNSTVSYPKPCK